MILLPVIMSVQAECNTLDSLHCPPEASAHIPLALGLGQNQVELGLGLQDILLPFDM